MGADAPGDGGGREIRLEGMGLVVLAFGFCLFLGAAFALGRWSAPAATAMPGSPDRASASDELPRAPSQGGAGSFFDSSKGPEKAAEPQRQVGGRIAAPGNTPLTAPGNGSPGPWIVQVFAGRDREAAESVVRGLVERGYPVRLESNREGADLLFRVRVGGYPSQADASAAAEKLRKEGETGAWVTRLK